MTISNLFYLILKYPFLNTVTMKELNIPNQSCTSGALNRPERALLHHSHCIPCAITCPGAMLTNTQIIPLKGYFKLYVIGSRLCV